MIGMQVVDNLLVHVGIAAGCTNALELGLGQGLDVAVHGVLPCLSVLATRLAAVQFPATLG